LAALFPKTRREDELMGEKSDALKNNARNAATEQTDRAKRAGRAAMEDAKAEAERQGLGPDGLRQEFDRKVEGAADVMKAAGRTAEEEAKRDAPSKSEVHAERSKSSASPSATPRSRAGVPGNEKP